MCRGGGQGSDVFKEEEEEDKENTDHGFQSKAASQSQDPGQWEKLVEEVLHFPRLCVISIMYRE